jgi:queuine tRNA-ribosyltransferase
MGPEESIRIQSNLGADVCMAFDECIPAKADRPYVKSSTERTTRWLLRCINEISNIKQQGGEVNPGQMLFGINQGGLYHDIRIDHAKRLAELDLPGLAIGGLAVGETHEEMYDILENVVPFLPRKAPTYLMGVGTPLNIIEAVYRGVDFFDCVLPARNGRHGHVFTDFGRLNLLNKTHREDSAPIEEGCPCPACKNHSRAYIRHLLKAGEMLGMRLCVLHNLYYYNNLMKRIREAICAGEFSRFKEKFYNLYTAQG